MSAAPQRPRPIITTDTKEYWEACGRHEFKIPKCQGCGQHFFYVRAYCPHCLSANWELVPASGRGKVHTFSVVRHGFGAFWREKVPYVAAIVELEEGPRMTTNVVGCAPEEVRVDMPVEVTFEDIEEGVAIPVFRPRRR